MQELRHSAELRGQEMPGGTRGVSQFQDIQLLLWIKSPLTRHEMLARGLPKLEITRACLSGGKEKHPWLGKLDIFIC